MFVFFLFPISSNWRLNGTWRLSWQDDKIQFTLFNAPPMVESTVIHELNSQLCEGVDPILSPAKLLTLEMEKLFGNCFGRLLCVLSVKNGRRTILNVYLTSPTCFTLMWARLWAARRLSRTLQLSHLRVLILEVKLQWCQRTGINSPPPHATFQVFLRPGSIEIIAEQLLF